MNKTTVWLGAIICAASATLAQQQNPGEVFFTGDLDCGISSNKTYTHAVTLGNRNEWGDPVLVNFVPFKRGGGGGGAMPNPQHTWSGIPGSPNDGQNVADVTTPSNQQVHRILADFQYDLSTNELVLAGLTPGQKYEFRLYSRCWGVGNNRQQLLTFQGADTFEFNPDDAIPGTVPAVPAATATYRMCTLRPGLRSA